jgi:hypothetical protein
VSNERCREFFFQLYVDSLINLWSMFTIGLIFAGDLSVQNVVPIVTSNER